MKRALKFCIFCFPVLFFYSVFADNDGIHAGMTLEDAIHHLQLQGLNIIYSSDVMNPQMVLKSDPKAATPRQILDEILAMFYLKVQSGPRKTLLIVHGHPPEPD